MLFDNFHELWLWQGYKPANPATSNEEVARFLTERKAAIKTAVKYSEEKYAESKRKIYLVAAGFEPVEFTNLFPFWVAKQDLVGLGFGALENAEEEGISLKYFCVS